MSEERRSEASAQSPAQAQTQSPTGNPVVGPALPEPATTNRKFVIAIIIGVVVILAITIGIIALLYSNPGPTAVIRDIFIIALAVVSFLIGILMLVLIIQLQSLIALLRNEIKPMLTNANQTVSAVRGTAVFVSDNLVKPTIGFASFVAGAQAVRQAFVGKVSSVGKKARSATQKPQGQSASQS